MTTKDPVTVIADALAKANGTLWDRMPGDPDDVYERDARAVIHALQINKRAMIRIFFRTIRIKT